MKFGLWTLVGLLVIVPSVHAGLFQQSKLVTSDASASSFVGMDVAISDDGSTSVVGGLFSNGNGGGAYVFTRSGINWTQQQELIPSSVAPGNNFGWSVSISGDGNTVAIGSKSETSGGQGSAGAVYVFTRTAGVWTQQQRLQSATPTFAAYLGSDVSLSDGGDKILAGAPGDGGSNKGAAYIFTRSGITWTQQQRVVNIGNSAGDSFGTGVALSGDGNVVLVGCQGLQLAYEFLMSGGVWTQSNIIAGINGSTNGFGAAVASDHDGNTLAVSALTADAAYLFTKIGSTWTQEARIFAPVTDFSRSLALDENGQVLAIANPQATSGGAVHIHHRGNGTWGENQILASSDLAASDYFGWSVSLSQDGEYGIFGALNEDNVAVNAGSAYVFFQILEPIITISFPESYWIRPNGTVTLTWSATDATSCTASGSWSGLKATSGSEPVTVPGPPGPKTFTLTCNGPGGTSQISITVEVTRAQSFAGEDGLIFGGNRAGLSGGLQLSEFQLQFLYAVLFIFVFGLIGLMAGGKSVGVAGSLVGLTISLAVGLVPLWALFLFLAGAIVVLIGLSRRQRASGF